MDEVSVNILSFYVWPVVCRFKSVLFSCRKYVWIFRLAMLNNVNLYLSPFFYSYKHAIDGLWRVYSEEGLKRMFGGASAATSRAVFMTIGQLSCYDQFKSFLISTPYFIDNSTTHFTASLMAVSWMATVNGY